LASDRALRVSAALKNLPPFPQVAAKVASLLATDPTAFRKIADTLQTDAALSAEVLRLANSPLMAVRYSVNSIVQALGLLGAQRLTNLVMTLGLSKFARCAGKSEAMRRLWRHNLACALAARHLAENEDGDSSEAYFAGLFHEVGRLALLVQDPARYDRALAQHEDLDQMERNHFDIDHHEAGAWVVEKWNLPRAFAEVALTHHDPSPQSSRLTLLVHVSCQIADQLGFSVLPVEGTPLELGPTDELGFSIALAINAWECEYGF